MRALTVIPGQSNSAQLTDFPDPPPTDGSILVRALALGICGTDREIVAGGYGTAPGNDERLILGHESLGRVEEAPPDGPLACGDLVVGIVRHPDPVPCANCAVGEWDMCRNGRYTEHGIKERHGFGAEWYRLEPDFAVRVDQSLGILGVLLEPASVVAKAWDHTERIGHRAHWAPRSALVTGAGPIGLLAALFAKQRGLEVHVLDRAADGPKPKLVRELGAVYHAEPLSELHVEPDIIMECTGAPAVIFDVLSRTRPAGIVCLTGVSSGRRTMQIDMSLLNRTIVLENDVVFGSVNANARHYSAAAAGLAAADHSWLARLITERVPIDSWREALKPKPDEVKTIIQFST